MPELTAGTVTFLFTDIEGSTHLLQQLGECYAGVLAECRQLLSTAFGQWHVQEVGTKGDTFFVAFSRASEAAAAAVTIQRALANHSWPQGASVRVCIGLHTGEPILSSDGYIGLDVHHAARIMSAGHGGQILLSQTTRELLEQHLPAGTSLRDLGRHRLKDLQRPSHLFQLSIAGLPADFPPLKTLDTHPNNLPIQPTPLIGREREVNSVCQLLRREEVCLLTLTGPGGTGKTRLSLQVAAELSDHFVDGVFFVNLAPISDPDLVVPTIAQTLALKESGEQPLLELLKAALREKHLLLLLDNFEQVVNAALQVAELLVACPEIKMLITSRVVLHVRAEQVFAVPPLTLPDAKHLPDLMALSHYAAVALFIQRAQAVKPDFQLTNANASAVAEVCIRLDGLPLAIELAAARIKLLSPQALLARLSHRLHVLTGGTRDLPARQQTLRNTIKWSYDLLGVQEQQVFRLLSVFTGGCTLEAAEAICQRAGNASIDVLNTVASVLDNSLLQQTEQEEEEPRLVLLETVREYGLEALDASGEAEATRQAHAAYYLALAEQAEPELRGTQQALWLSRLEAEYNNFRVALGWALENGEVEIGLRLAGVLWRFWMVRGHFTEGRGWLERVQERSSDAAPALQAKAFTGAGSMAWSQGNYRQAMRWHQQALALYREVGDKQGIAFALNNLGIQAQYQGDYESARAFLQESQALYRELGDQWGIAIVLGNLGLGEASQGNYERARALFEEELALFRELKAKVEIALALHNLGDVARYQGDHRRAMAYLEECLSVCEELGDKRLTSMTLNILGLIARWQGDFARSAALHIESLALSRELGEKLCIAQSLEGLAGVYGMQKHPERAARLLGAAEAVREAINAPLLPIDRADYGRIVSIIRAQLDEAAFAVVWAEGRTMTPEQALAALPRIFSPAEDAAILHQQRAMQPVQAFRIEIDGGQLAQEVAEITESDFFQHLLQQVQHLRPEQLSTAGQE